MSTFTEARDAYNKANKTYLETGKALHKTLAVCYQAKDDYVKASISQEVMEVAYIKARDAAFLAWKVYVAASASELALH